MNYQFTKMHGCGNDYIYFNGFDAVPDAPEEAAIRLSHRHTGIGGDGIVLILPSDTADAKMRMFNSDGSEGNMCGNAIRCVAKYLYDSGLVVKPHMTIETRSGLRELYPEVRDGLVCAVTVNMGRPELRPEKIPVRLPGETAIARPMVIGGAEYAVTCVSMGNPHAVVFCQDVDHYDVQRIGSQFEHDPHFPEQVNTEFVEISGQNRLKMRVWERGSGETQACGTGACAAAVAAVYNGHCSCGADITVCLPGGELTIRCADDGVYMTGNCVRVFDGTVAL